MCHRAKRAMIIFLKSIVREVASMIERSSEDEAFEEIERRQATPVRPSSRLRTADEAFAEWNHSHRPSEHWIERKAFLAGWAAGVRNEFQRERND